MFTRGGMTFYTDSEVSDMVLGVIGTPERDAYEAEIELLKQQYSLGETVKEARLGQHLTQAELAARIGVKPEKVSRVERGKVADIFTLAKLFRALNIESVDLGKQFGRVAVMF